MDLTELPFWLKLLATLGRLTGNEGPLCQYCRDRMQKILRRFALEDEGILGPQDVQRMRDAGVHAFLVGEAFMRAPDPGVALEALFK